MQTDKTGITVPQTTTAITASAMLELLNIAQERCLDELDYDPECDTPEEREQLSEEDLQQLMVDKNFYEDVVNTFEMIAIAIERGFPKPAIGDRCPDCGNKFYMLDHRKLIFCDECGQLVARGDF